MLMGDACDFTAYRLRLLIKDGGVKNEVRYWKRWRKVEEGRKKVKGGRRKEWIFACCGAAAQYNQRKHSRRLETHVSREDEGD